MSSYHHQTALVTGASSGIGAAFARALAARGADLVLVARSAGTLQALAEELRGRHGVRIDVLPADLRAPEAAATLARELQQRGLRIDVLVNNAGASAFGAFGSGPLSAEHDSILLNVAAVVALTHTLLPAMLDRGAGAIINIASIGSFVPMPYQAVYGGTKAFVLAFSDALRAEVQGRGVRVFALCPGPVATPFFDTPGGERFAAMPKMTPERVVADGLRAFDRGRQTFVPGLNNWLLTQLPRFLPRAAVTQIMDGALRPKPPQPHAGTQRTR